MTDVVDALKALVNPTTLLAFLFLIVPGTISLRVYDRLRSRQSRKITESIIDIIIVSFINDLIWSPIFQFSKFDFRNATFPNLSVAVVEILAFLVTPIILACLYAFGENILAKFGLVSDTEPRPWDKWFTTVKREKRDVAVILIMKSDHRAIAGRYIPPGFASSEPAEESIHIGQTWKLIKTPEHLYSRWTGHSGFSYK